MQVREQLLSLPEAVVLLRGRLLDLYDQARRLEDLVWGVDDARPARFVLLVLEAGPDPGTRLDDHLVPVVDQLRDPVRLHRHPLLVVLDLLRNPDHRSHENPFPDKSVRRPHTLHRPAANAQSRIGTSSYRRKLEADRPTFGLGAIERSKQIQNKGRLAGDRARDRRPRARTGGTLFACYGRDAGSRQGGPVNMTAPERVASGVY